MIPPESHQPGNSEILEQTAEALMTYADLLDRHGPQSRECRDFLAAHGHLPEFQKLAEESRRLEELFGPTPAVAPSVELTKPKSAGQRPLWIYLASGFAAVVVLCGLMGGLAYSASQASQYKTQYEQTAVKSEKLQKQLEQLQGIATDWEKLQRQQREMIQHQKEIIVRIVRTYNAQVAAKVATAHDKDSKLVTEGALPKQRDIIDQLAEIVKKDVHVFAEAGKNKDDVRLAGEIVKMLHNIGRNSKGQERDEIIRAIQQLAEYHAQDEDLEDACTRAKMDLEGLKKSKNKAGV